MRRVGIRTLRLNLSRELEDLPFEIVKYGRVVALCTQIVEGLKGVHKISDKPSDCVHNSKSDEDDLFRPLSKSEQVGKK